jgi:hypothetical protein
MQQKTWFKTSLEKVTKRKNCFKWREWFSNAKGPLFSIDKFALP